MRKKRDLSTTWRRESARIRELMRTTPSKDLTQRYLLWKRVKASARAKGLRFDLTIEDIVIPKKCPVLGIAIQLGGERETSISFDRIHNDRGYVKGNVVIISLRANRLKSDAYLHELERIAKFYRSLGATK